MVYASLAIATLSFVVWLHHFFTMGAGANVNAFFGIATMVIAVPTGVKVFNWIFTIYRGRLEFTTPILWTLGFIVTFCIGGMTGVLLAVPGADFQLHNSEFLIAHFHNMLIPGALFGYFAGYAYWFPKIFGFRLNETWGKRAFWLWLVGFYLAFMPLYALGFMGMPRRLVHYDNPLWQPYLVTALVGTLLIFAGILCQILQLTLSIQQRRLLQENTGDPWNGRTLEWSIPCPAPAWNFAHLPTVHARDDFHVTKQSGQAPPSLPYSAILLPAASGLGPIMGALAFLLGFGLVWYLWWMAAVALAGLVLCLLVRSLDDETEFLIPATTVEATERALRRIASSPYNASQVSQ
jgi:cytochrome o ubiquinol oxidase subunit 1